MRTSLTCFSGKFAPTALICLAAARLNAAGATDATNEVTLPPYRYLFVIDTSSAMSRQKATAIDTIHKLILSGINGRVRTGETFGIWTFNEELSTDAFPPQMWIPEQTMDVANRVYRFLRDQKPTKKAHLDEVWLAIREAASVSGALTAFLFSDGTSLLNGTPFDDEINQIFKNHATGMHKVKKPFVVVFVAEEGQVVAQAVSPGGGPIYIPQIKKRAPDAQPSTKQENSVPAAPRIKPTPEPKPPQRADQPAVQAASTSATKPLSVEAIQAELARQSARKQSDAVTSAPPPATPRAQTQSAPPGDSNTEPPTIVKQGTESVPVAPPANLERQKTENLFVPDAVAEETRQQDGPQAPKGDGAGQQSYPAKGDQSHGEIPRAGTAQPAKQFSAPPTGGPTAESKPTDETLAERSSPAPAPQQAAVVVPNQSGDRPRIFLLIGSLLLAVTVVLGWLFFRTGRSAPRPSLISRSMENREE